MVKSLEFYANAARANVTKGDLNKIQKEQTKALTCIRPANVDECR